MLYSVDEQYDPQANNSGELPSSNAARIRISASFPRFHIGDIMLTQKELKSRLSYDPGTGILTWINKPNKSISAGREAGCLMPNGYRGIRVDGTLYYAHRLAWLYMHGEWPDPQIDHINRHRSDNRIGNLRRVTNAQNSINKRDNPPNMTGYRGVYRCGVRYVAKIKKEGKQYYIGTYDTPREAHVAYCKKGREFFGKYFYGGRNE